MIRRGLILAAILSLSQPGVAQAQRKPAFEVYALTGAYLHGNVSVAIEWKPHVGAGALAPLGTKWGALLDVTTSAVEGYWNPGGMPGAAGLKSNSSQERRVAFTPAIVRLWRRHHFSIYAGAGIGAEHAW